MNEAAKHGTMHSHTPTTPFILTHSRAPLRSHRGQAPLQSMPQVLSVLLPMTVEYISVVYKVAPTQLHPTTQNKPPL